MQQQHSFLDWCISSFQRMEKEDRELLVAVAWAIWNARNDRVWQNKIKTVENIVMSAKCYLSQWKHAHSSGLELLSAGLNQGDGAEHWVPPIENNVKVNVDAAIFEASRQFGVGWVARDARGLLIHGHTKLFNVQATPELAEAVGIREALSWIKSSGLQQVVLETDCLSIVQALRSSIVMISTFGQVVNECKALLNDLRTISIYFIHRSANTVAHELARASVSFPDCNFSLDSVPTVLLHVLVTNMII
ncbi:uncharacterized protein LOC115710603 [Cannabis sativa]|uniref:uncharacterized protein LOC115710603 n=1 Tax=Cannabis sativa TaxID=3483 RepID=UPI0029CA59E3|nr:uncharacterized protein LOC115710603 [Cannabis sativa]